MKLNTEHITENSRFWSEVNALAKEVFPPQEYLAPSKLVEMAKADNFDFLALTDNNSFVGFIVVQTYRNLAYLFFLAIVSTCRSKGYGSQAKTLKTEYPNKKQVVDFEMRDDTADNYKQREKRREFYLRNGRELSYIVVAKCTKLCYDNAHRKRGAYMPQIRPITDLRNTNDISDVCHAAKEPIFITKNGYGDLVVMSIETYEQIVETQLVDNAISEAEEEYGATDILLDAKETLASLRRKHFG